MALILPEFLQTKKYSAKAMRAMLGDTNLQKGVVNTTDLKVSQRAAGATMGIDVAAGAAWVPAAGTRQGFYHAYNDAVAQLAIAANSSGQPRVDQVILRIYDTTDGAAVQDIAAVEIVQGVGTAGAQVATPGAAGYRAGAGSVPNSSMVIADILVANGAASITNANIVDRRPWSRGLFYDSGAGGTGVFTGTLRGPYSFEFSGAPVVVQSSGQIVFAGVNGTNYLTNIYAILDSVTPLPDINMLASASMRSTGDQDDFGGMTILYPAAGRHSVSLLAIVSTSPAIDHRYARFTLQENIGATPGGWNTSQ